MASVLELDICYHQNVVVQGNELLKSDDAFLLKGIVGNGTSAFFSICPTKWHVNVAFHAGRSTSNIRCL